MTTRQCFNSLSFLESLKLYLIHDIAILFISSKGQPTNSGKMAPFVLIESIINVEFSLIPILYINESNLDL